MAEQTLTKWLKAGYPYLKAGSGLPVWLLPERSLNGTADELGDSGILKMSEPLELASGIEATLEHAPDPARFSPEVWQNAVMHWLPLPQVKPVVGALLEAANMITAQLNKGQLTVEPMVVCRSMLVIAFAPFIPIGKPVIQELTCILGGNASEPADLITSYAEAVVSGDVQTVEKVNECIVKYSAWAKWAAIVQEQTLKCQYTPRLIAVTPLLSAELAGVLASMIKEGQHDESRGDPPEYPGSQVCAH